MKMWIARRFKYTRDLERWLSESEMCARERENTIDSLKTKWGKLTLADASIVFHALADYHKILHQNVMPDPVEPRIKHLFDKYNVKVDPPLDFLPRRG